MLISIPRPAISSFKLRMPKEVLFVKRLGFNGSPDAALRRECQSLSTTLCCDMDIRQVEYGDMIHDKASKPDLLQLVSCLSCPEMVLGHSLDAMSFFS
jgi:hypothetical protein